MGSTAAIPATRAPAGVRYVEHTADTAIEVRAPTLEACFARAAAAMFAVVLRPPANTAPVESVDLDVRAGGVADLLVAWLEELLYLSEVKGLALLSFTVVRVSRGRVRGSARGSKFGRDALVSGPAVKGVSRHALSVKREGGSWHARVIFDV